MSHLVGQVALITGGSSGIGLAIASALVKEGMCVAITARDEKRLKKAVAQLRKEGGEVIAAPGDVSKAAQVNSFVKKVISEKGRVDLLVNNAGIYLQGPIDKISEADWDAVQDVNLKGAFLYTKAVLPTMRKQHSGYVVNISSLAGKMGFGETSAYCASKFGMMALTESLMNEAAKDGIKATAVCPGYVATPMVAHVGIPPEEMVPAEDIAKLVIDLLHLSKNTIIKEIVVNRVGAIDD